MEKSTIKDYIEFLQLLNISTQKSLSKYSSQYYYIFIKTIVVDVKNLTLLRLLL